MALLAHLEPFLGTYEGPAFVAKALRRLGALLQRIASRARQLVAGPEPTPPEVQAPLLKVFGAEPREPSSPRVDGFNLHVGTSFEAHERVALERYGRDALRGPLALGRLSETPTGSLVYRLRAPKADGTTHVVFSPQTLRRRLSWLSQDVHWTPARQASPAAAHPSDSLSRRAGAGSSPPVARGTVSS